MHELYLHYSTHLYGLVLKLHFYNTITLLGKRCLAYICTLVRAKVLAGTGAEQQESNCKAIKPGPAIRC